MRTLNNIFIITGLSQTSLKWMEMKKCDSNHSQSLWSITLEVIEDQDISLTTKIMNGAHQYLEKDT